MVCSALSLTFPSVDAPRSCTPESPLAYKNRRFSPHTALAPRFTPLFASEEKSPKKRIVPLPLKTILQLPFPAIYYVNAIVHNLMIVPPTKSAEPPRWISPPPWP